METPIRIGTQSFAHGLGTHANSELAVTIPEGAAQFKAFVGIDNNDDTKGKNGSVQFSVVIEDKELVRTDVMRGGVAPFPIAITVAPALSK